MKNVHLPINHRRHLYANERHARTCAYRASIYYIREMIGDHRVRNETF